MTATRVIALPDGREVTQITLRNGPMRAEVLTLGAIVQGLWIEGVAHSVILGCPDIAHYLGKARYFGAIVGRVANRIGGGRFMLDGQEHRTDRNFLGKHTLHGGDDGADIQIWQIGELSESCATLTLSLPDGHMGFPGRMDMAARISLASDGIAFDLTARSDAATPCSLTHHGLFDLDGAGDIRNHRLWIDAEHYLPIDDELIPTGDIAPVAGTGFDFRAARPIGDTGLDHNFCLSDASQPLRRVAELTGASGLKMTIETTACGLQLYDGAYIDDLPGHDGHQYGAHAGVALEAQEWPDAVNRPAFPTCILLPGETYSSSTRYVFGR
ncbi:galactose mutarotase [Paracoccus aurantiacus]|uniref:Aldose 1-epimerase n=1 Tax=Paracoccus aurantiacus TaxID=2599412 RepID=A0A5C6RPB5_9RHOB|nr:aldose epimerase family protein [Paracoccus aurantiacus]TXB64063.1 galactose mutarotase [Paracoccus aurantiacus]